MILDSSWPARITDDMVARYVTAQTIYDRNTALAIVDEALNADIPLPSVYIDLIQRAQYEIGDLWQDCEITVAQEHGGTAISQLAVARLYSRFPNVQPLGRTALVACVEGELHDMGAHMASDFFELHGFDVVYLGANVPTDSLIRSIADVQPDVVGLSVTMPCHAHVLPELVQQIQTLGEGHVNVIVGGRGLSGLETIPENIMVAGGPTETFATIHHFARQLTAAI